MPIGIILRDVLKLSRSQRESKRILATRKVLVDGRVVVDHGRAVGLMDVLTVGDDNYRCVLDTNGKLRYRSIPKKEASAKPCRIVNKTTIKGGKMQYTLHDGRTFLSETPDEYSIGDTLVISLPGQEISAHHPFEAGAVAYMTGGSHVGETSKIKEIEIKRSTRPNEVVFDEFGTIASYAFVIPSAKALPLEANS
jgi:small subunit ribosomal protein S4e|tara:strand:- start:1850 stop:2434 length:585 start_codon:yes stop_codon:yes gene_type:complete